MTPHRTPSRLPEHGAERRLGDLELFSQLIDAALLDTHVLGSRVQALLRRGRGSAPLRLNVKDLHIDLVTHKVERAGRRIELTAREFDLLEYLVRHAHATVSREMLAHEIWKDVGRATPLDNVIDVHIARLRRKIDGPNLTKLIHTVRGVGFCLSDSELN